VPAGKERQTRKRASLYDEATRAALIVLWEASDRVCGQATEGAAAYPAGCDGTQRTSELNAEIRPKILSMSAATIDRFCACPEVRPEQEDAAGHARARRRIKMRTVATEMIGGAGAAWRWTWWLIAARSIEAAYGK